MPEIKFKDHARVGESVYSTVLGNGLAVYVIPKPEFAKSYAFFAVNYGGMDLEFTLDGVPQSTPAGVAHFLEHKMFDMPEGNALQTLSARGANPNAFTSSAITAYHFSCTEGFYDNLRTLLEFVTTPYFTPESVEKEQGIIGQEIGMYADDADYSCYVNLLDCLYEHHPVKNSVLGTVDSIAQITDATLNACHSAFYSPANMVLCCAGDVDIARVKALAEECCPAVSPVVARAERASEPQAAAKSSVTRQMQVSMPQFMLGFKLDAPGNGQEHALLPILADTAGAVVAGPSSALYSELYAEGLINGSFGAGSDVEPGAAFAYFAGESREPEAVMERILSEARRIAEQGIDEALLVRTLKAAYGAEVRGLNSMENICYNQAEAHFRGYEYFDFPALYDAVSSSVVQSFIDRYFTRERMALSVIRPAD